jgi:hypothetical protein
VLLLDICNFDVDAAQAKSVVPATVSGAVGAVVPMPTLPDEFIVNATLGYEPGLVMLKLFEAP